MGCVKIAGFLFGMTLRHTFFGRRHLTSLLHAMVDMVGIVGMQRASGFIVMSVRMHNSCPAERDRNSQDNLEEQVAHDLRIRTLCD